MKKLSNILHNRLVISSFGMFFGSFIYCFSVVFILDKGNFYAGGITGISQILANVIIKQPMLKSVFVAVFNIPLFIMGWRSVSKRFAVLSLASVGLQVALIALFQLAYDKGFDPLKDMSDNTLILALVGGMLCGAGCGIPLRCGSSTGGMDIISNYLVMKKRISFVKYQFTVDVIIIVASSLISVENVLYTIVRLIVYMKVIEAVYKIYETIRIEVITNSADDIKKKLFENFSHSLTIYDAVGGYTGQGKKVIEAYISNFELNEYLEIIKNEDPNAFVVISQVKTIRGNYVQRTVV